MQIIAPPIITITRSADAESRLRGNVYNAEIAMTAASGFYAVMRFALDETFPSGATLDMVSVIPQVGANVYFGPIALAAGSPINARNANPAFPNMSGIFSATNGASPAFLGTSTYWAHGNQNTLIPTPMLPILMPGHVYGICWTQASGSLDCRITITRL